MIIPVRLLLVLVLPLVALVTSSCASKNTASLRNKKDSVKLTAEQQAWFGPKSANLKYDSRMVRAAQIAAARAGEHSTARCWRSVKTALLHAEAIDSYPKTRYAKQAGNELENDYGFERLPGIGDPYEAPIGAVLVYGGKGPGHVEIRTPAGFVSDFTSDTPSKRPLIGVYVKPKNG